MKKKLFVWILALLLLTGMLTGCGARAPMEDAAADAPAADAPAMAPMESADGLSTSANGSTPSLPEGEKIITTLRLEAQTNNMEAVLGKINSKIAELGGYVQSQDIYNGSNYGSYRYRYANMTIRIPAEKLSSFVSHVSENANIVSENTATENVTLTYVAVESRITALEAERDRLLELMAQAKDMKDLLLIEERLTEVVSELEEMNSTLRLYDNLVSYSTVHLNLEEVKEYTEVEEEPETVWDRISTGFTKSLNNMVKGMTNFFVFVVTRLPYLVPIALIGGVVLLITWLVKRHNEKKSAKELPKNPPEEPAE